MGRGLTVSVALCTFNGERYLGEQLRSIRDQEVQPDEIVICDDCSTDQTCLIVEGFQADYGGTLHFKRNSRNIGSTRNFERCVQDCSGEVIVLADQDDKWYPQKLRMLVQKFGDPSVGLVFSDADLLDAQGQNIGFTLWDAIQFGPRKQRHMRAVTAFDLLLRRFVVTGATMAFRRSLLPFALPFSRHLIHDAWLALVLAAISRCDFVERPLVGYRQHAAQQIGEQKRGLLGQYRRARDMGENYFVQQRDAFADVLERVSTLENEWVHPRIGAHAADKLTHCERRIELRNNRLRKLPTLVGEALSGRYSRFGYGWKSVAQDLFL